VRGKEGKGDEGRKFIRFHRVEEKKIVMIAALKARKFL
jgi:hypothetical protein